MIYVRDKTGHLDVYPETEADRIRISDGYLEVLGYDGQSLSGVVAAYSPGSWAKAWRG